MNEERCLFVKNAFIFNQSILILEIEEKISNDYCPVIKFSLKQ